MPTEEKKKTKRKDSALKRFLVKRTGAKAVTEGLSGKKRPGFVPETAPKGVTLTEAGKSRMAARNRAARAEFERGGKKDPNKKAK